MLRTARPSFSNPSTRETCYRALTAVEVHLPRQRFSAATPMHRSQLCPVPHPPCSASPRCKGSAAPSLLYIVFGATRFRVAPCHSLENTRLPRGPTSRRDCASASTSRRASPTLGFAQRVTLTGSTRASSSAPATATWADHRPRLEARRPRKLCRGQSACNGLLAAPFLAAALAGILICA